MKRLLPLLLLALAASSGCALFRDSGERRILVLDEAGRPVEGAVIQWQESKSAGPFDGCCYYGPGVYIAERATFTDESGTAFLDPQRFHCNGIRVVLSPDLRRYSGPPAGTNVLSLSDFHDVDFSLEFYGPDNCATVGPREWMSLFDHRIAHFTDPEIQKGSAFFSAWSKLRDEARRARRNSSSSPATPSPAEETHAESAETAEPEPHAESAEDAE